MIDYDDGYNPSIVVICKYQLIKRGMAMKSSVVKPNGKSLSLKVIFLIGIALYLMGFLVTRYVSAMAGSWITILSSIVLLVWIIDGIIYLIKKCTQPK